MSIKFDNLKEIVDHLTEVCAAFNHTLEIKPIVNNGSEENQEITEKKKLGDLKAGGTQ